MKFIVGKNKYCFKLTKYTLLLFWFSLVLFPIFSVDRTDVTGFDVLSDYSTGKIIRVLFTILTFLTGQLYILNFLKFNKFKDKSICKYLLFVYIMFAILSVLLNTPTSMVAWYRIIELVTYYVSAIYIVDELVKAYGQDNIVDILLNGIFFITKTMLVVMFVLAFYDTDFIYMVDVEGRSRLGGFAYRPNTLAILFILSLCSVTYMKLTHKLNCLHYSLWVVVLHILVYLTGSRTGLAILLMCDILLINKYNMLSTINRSIINALIIVSSACFAISILIGLSSKNILKFLGHGNDSLMELLTLNSRLSVFLTAINGIIKKPIIGYGYVDGVRKYLAENYPLGYWLPHHTHNSFLEILLSQGVVGGASMIIFGALVFFTSFKVMISNKQQLEDISLSLMSLIILASSLMTIPMGNEVTNVGVIFVMSGYILYLRKFNHNKVCPDTVKTGTS
jgi:O-antigen ligase